MTSPADFGKSGTFEMRRIVVATAIFLGVGIFPLCAEGANRRTPVVEAVEKAGPAVVNISTEQVLERQTAPFPGFRDPFLDEFFRDFVEPHRERFTRSSLGSGVIVRPDGYILTNQHVILQGGRIRVTLADERNFDARLVGTDSDSDLAVLKVDSDHPLPVIPMGDSDSLMIGETAIAIGNPFGLSHTVTTGVVSAVDRSLNTKNQTFYDFIQTDASINPGNSGGPLLDINGELIGINTAIYQKAQGIGFAIPINRARRIVNDLISFGEVQAPWVGAVVQNLTDELAAHFDLPTQRGVLVRQVETGSRAREAGIKRGDIITAVNDHPVHSSAEYAQRIRDHAPGSEIRLTIWRDSQTRSIALKARTFPLERADSLAWDLIGVRLEQKGRDLVVASVRRGGSAANIGVRPGDVLAGLAGVSVHSMAKFRKKMIEVRNSRTVLISIRRGNRIYHVTVPLGGDS